ncbi:hypothetical protein ACFTAO_33605 [Paenibacillus rhizoplanae]
MTGRAGTSGGVRDPLSGVAWPNHTGTAQYLAAWAAALVNEQSRYYRDLVLLEQLHEGMSFMLRFQHEDGTISPGWTNYHSPPDTAFVVVGLANILTLLERESWPPLKPVTDQIRTFLVRTIPAMLTGGCTYPESPLGADCCAGVFVPDFFALEELQARAGEWLQEGMDITPDGEWTERSNGIYNTVSDIMLYYAAQDLNRPELLEPVRLNLRMMKYLVHPDGEVVTDYSGRQDFGSVYSLADYYLCYQLMAEHDRDPEFAALAELASRSVIHPGSLPNQIMLGFLLYPQMQAASVAPGELPDSYRKVINGAWGRQELIGLIGQGRLRRTCPPQQAAYGIRRSGCPGAQRRDQCKRDDRGLLAVLAAARPGNAAWGSIGFELRAGTDYDGYADGAFRRLSSGVCSWEGVLRHYSRR